MIHLNLCIYDMLNCECHLVFVDIKPGHIKGSISIPFTILIDPKTKQMKSADTIRELFKNYTGDLDDITVVAMCGSGEFFNYALLVKKFSFIAILFVFSLGGKPVSSENCLAFSARIVGNIVESTRFIVVKCVVNCGILLTALW